MDLRRSRAPTAILFLVLATACAGCATASGEGEGSSPAARTASFLRERALDAVDVVSLRAAFGPALLVHARVTHYAQLGIGQIGRPQGVQAGFRLPVRFLGWVHRRGGVWTERRAEFGIGPWYSCEGEGHVEFGDVDAFPPETRDPYDLGVALHVALVGVEADFRPDELLDFVAGWFGFDPKGDDASGPAVDSRPD